MVLRLKPEYRCKERKRIMVNLKVKLNVLLKRQDFAMEVLQGKEHIVNKTFHILSCARALQ